MTDNESVVSYFFRFLITQTMVAKNDTLLNEKYTVNNFVVNTNVGSIRGLRANDGNYTMYTGIPYGKVNDKNPFGPSTPYPKFDHIFDASTDLTICPQPEEGGTLDCLILNIYVPDSASSENLLPIMFWIHGGGFIAGSGHSAYYGPKLLISHDVILVTINYRLGPYGFMCLNTPEIPGNQGLKDQLLALRWVNDNIIFFGGDKDKITLFGQDAGSISAHLHLLSRHEKLFDKVILQSGTAFLPGVVRKADLSIPITLAKKLGSIATDVNAAITFLENGNLDDIARAAATMDILSWWPCIDSASDEQFIFDYPVNLKVPKVQNKSVMVGFTDDETMSFLSDEGTTLLEELGMYWNYLRVCFNFDKKHLEKIENIVMNFYVDSKEYIEAIVFERANYLSDIIFGVPADRTITSLLENGAKDVFYYMFSHIGERNYAMKTSNVTLGGAVHGDELGYLFDIMGDRKMKDADKKVVDKITTMWTNYAKYGHPTPNLNVDFPVRWNSVTQHSPRHFMAIDQDCFISTNPFHDRISFWNLFFDTKGKYEKGYRERNHASDRTICIVLLVGQMVMLLGL